MRYELPKNLLDYFVNDALKNKTGNKLLETLAYGIGRLEKEDNIVIEELVFPGQTSTDVKVEDTGKTFCTF